jgi:hypothetical protein
MSSGGGRHSPTGFYPVASLTKGDTSTIVLQLAAEGRRDLDAPVSRYRMKMDRRRPVRVRHLLSHHVRRSAGYQLPLRRLRVRAAHGRHRAARGASVGVRGRGPDRAPAQPGFHRALHERDGGDPFLRLTLEPSPEDAGRARAGVRRRRLRPRRDREGARSGLRSCGGPVGLAERPRWPDASDVPRLPPLGHRGTRRVCARRRALLDGAGRWPAAAERVPREGLDPPGDGRGERLPYALGWFVQWHQGERLVWSATRSSPPPSW